MATDIFRFEFERNVPLDEAEMSLQLAVIAVQGLFGEARVRTDAAYHLDEPRRALIVDGTTLVGTALVRVFTQLLISEFGGETFIVRRVEPCRSRVSEGVAA